MADTPASRRTLQAAVTAMLAPIFDWRALVAQSQPGDATPSQRAQAKRLTITTDELAAWAAPFELPTAFIRPSAMFAVVCTPPDAPADLTSSLARLILWYYSFDTALDTQTDERIGDAGWVNAAIQVCLFPVVSKLQVVAWRRLGWRDVPYAAKAPMPILIRRLSAALADWRLTTLASLEVVIPDDSRRQFWWNTLLQQLARSALLMWQELAWTSAWRAGTLTEPPTARTYMQVACRTVGVQPTFALTCAGLGVAPQIWRMRRPLLDAAARVIRLANDAASAQADLAARNITAVTATLLRQRSRAATQAPHATGAGDPVAQGARALAQAQVKRRLDTAVNTFARRLAQQPPGPDADYLRYTVAWALAHYALT